MATYNIIKNGFFTSNTSSGTGNVDLTITDLNSLVDNVTTSGISLVQSDTLYLDVNLHTRIKVGGIFIYSDDLTKVANIDFLYKNYIDDEYTLCTKTVTAAYNGHIPEPSAPQYVRCIISGVDIEINEFSIVNNDHIIGFGEDGLDNETWIDNTPIGALGIPQEVIIYNNSDPSTATVNANAYVCVDYTGAEKNDFIKISKNEEGPYLGYEHGAIVGYEWKDWDSGAYDNTYNDTIDNTLKISDKSNRAILFASKIADLPLDNCSYGQTPFGVNCATTYDSDNGKIYVAFYNGTEIANGILRLYSYTLSNNVWEFVTDLIGITVIDATRVSICYNNNKIYYFYYNSGYWYVHDLLGTVNNYTLLASRQHQNNHGLEPYNSLTSDGDNYIYSMCDYRNSYPYYSSFYRYSISGNSWTVLSKTMLHLGNRNKIVYDTTLNMIYFISLNTSSKWVQRYRTVENIWDQQFFDLTRLDDNFSNINFEFYNNKLYFCNSAYGAAVFVYDISIDMVSKIIVGFSFHDIANIYIIPTEPQGILNDVSLYGFNTTTGSYQLFGYNTDFDQIEGINSAIKGLGYYTTNIIFFDDPFKASYIIVDSKTDIGLNSVNSTGIISDNSIDVRSSTIPPTSIDEIYWIVSFGTITNHITKYTIGNDLWEPSWWSVTENHHMYVGTTAIDRRSGRIFYSTYSGDDVVFKILSRSGTTLYSSGYYNSTNNAYINYGAYFDKYKGVWVYFKNGNYFRHWLYDFSVTWTTYVDDMYDFCAELDGEGLWYTERSSDTLVRLDFDCTAKVVINLYDPYGVCGTEDNGCWVVDKNDAIYGNCIKRYDWDGNLIRVVTTGDTAAVRITHDHQSGFYARTDYELGEVWHYTSEGVRDMKVTGLFNEDYLRGGRRGVVLYSTTYKRIRYLDLATQTVLWTKNYREEVYNGSYNDESIPDIFSWDEYTEDIFTDDYGSKLLPVDYDTTWYGETSLEWKKVPKDGYFLPKCRYHQIRVTLINYDNLTTPVVKSISMAPAIKIEDILPQQSKPVYVRSDIPAEEEVSLFNTRLKVWWDVEDDN